MRGRERRKKASAGNTGSETRGGKDGKREVKGREDRTGKTEEGGEVMGGEAKGADNSTVTLLFETCWR